MVYADASRSSQMVDGFTKKTFTAMVEAWSERDAGRRAHRRTHLEAGDRDLYRTAEPDGTFSYTFCQAVERRRAPGRT